MKFRYSLIAAGIVALAAAGSASAQEKTFRLLTWADYAPADVVAQFEKESGYKVELHSCSTRSTPLLNGSKDPFIKKYGCWFI